jgi:monolysocardiolipin acyltransferase
MPTHRIAHSPYGGLFQPTMTQAIRLLSSQPFNSTTTPPHTENEKKNLYLQIQDPFSTNISSYPTFSTTGHDLFPAPSGPPLHRHAWLHIHPEGKVHQPPPNTSPVMRYFKWGISRLILESDNCPEVVPMWIEGLDKCMNEERGWPRPLPRIGQDVKICFGDAIREDVFGDCRRRWRELVLAEEAAFATKAIKEKHLQEGGTVGFDIGIVPEESSLRDGREAVELREEVTRRVRRAVLDVRKSRGWEDEDPKVGLAETYRLEGEKAEGKMKDGSIVKDV